MVSMCESQPCAFYYVPICGMYLFSYDQCLKWCAVMWWRQVLCEGIGFSLVSVVDGIPKKRIVEKLWQKFFSDPSLWWDHKLLKVTEIICCHSPDSHAGFHYSVFCMLRHLVWSEACEQYATLLNSTKNLLIVEQIQGIKILNIRRQRSHCGSMTHGFFVLWVKALLAAKAPCSAHFNIFQQCVRLARYVGCGQCQETLSLSEGIVPDTTFRFMSTWRGSTLHYHMK